MLDEYRDMGEQQSSAMERVSVICRTILRVNYIFGGKLLPRTFSTFQCITVCAESNYFVMVACSGNALWCKYVWKIVTYLVCV